MVFARLVTLAVTVTLVVATYMAWLDDDYLGACAAGSLTGAWIGFLSLDTTKFRSPEHDRRERD